MISIVFERERVNSRRVFVAGDAVAWPPSSVNLSSVDHSVRSLFLLLLRLRIRRRLSSQVDILYTSAGRVSCIKDGWMDGGSEIIIQCSAQSDFIQLGFTV